MDGEFHSADTHLAEARDQNPGNGISGHILSKKAACNSIAAFLLASDFGGSGLRKGPAHIQCTLVRLKATWSFSKH